MHGRKNIHEIANSHSKHVSAYHEGLEKRWRRSL
jgi:hypothetical protein